MDFLERNVGDLVDLVAELRRLINLPVEHAMKTIHEDHEEGHARFVMEEKDDDTASVVRKNLLDQWDGIGMMKHLPPSHKHSKPYAA